VALHGLIRGTISQPFGPSGLRVEPTMYGKRDAAGWVRCRPTAFAGAVKFSDFHPGVDVGCPVGTPILAPHAGTVVARVPYRVWSPIVGAYVMGLYAELRYFRDGTTQKLLHADHLKSALAVGSHVDADQPWARSGASGIVTGPHVHLEDRHGPAGDHWSESWGWFRHNPERTL
jgi:murein DD-endopeptidase MepM/ murein hydrolase activator NlpD